MSPREWLYVVLIAIPVVDLVAAVLLWHFVRQAGGWRRSPGSLKDRAVAASLIFVAASLVAVLAFFALIHVRLPVTLAIIAAAVILPSLTSVAWVVRWLTGGFGTGDD